ncbi:MAG: hypothetical protein EOP83_22935 [Verrucomicrobiaceae bacterium]|nr:MAG: hypothetical protein EOP83_22935 [Verrucomicrobiaceae bacterium]
MKLSDTLNKIRARLTASLSFTLWYDYAPTDGETFWVIRPPESLDRQPQVNGTMIKLIAVDYLSGSLWRFQALGIRYTFESIKKVRFYFDGKKAVDSETGLRYEDTVSILKFNPDLRTGLGLGRNYDLALSKTVTYSDGYADPRRITVQFSDRDEDGFPDDPDTYYKIATQVSEDSLLFWQRGSDGLFTPYNEVWVYETEEDRASNVGAVSAPPGTVAFQIASDKKPETFWLRTANDWEQQYRGYRFARGRGSNVARQWVVAGGRSTLTPEGSTLNFQWKHYAPSDHRVDPSKTNIIDMFVLTYEYDFLVRQWIRNGANPKDKPQPPTETALRTTFGNYESFKMFSDEIIWRPVRYKFLFGKSADFGLQATFKVVKLPTSTLSDGETKAAIVNAINAYFSTDYWDFGETFYFTELAAYVHNQLSTSIASIVIVPLTNDGSFGDGFEVSCRSDELFISTATVENVTLISSNTPTNLRIR